MAFELIRRGAAQQHREFDLAVRTILAQWEIDAAAAEQRRQMLFRALDAQLEQRQLPELGWRRQFESGAGR